MRRWAAGLAVVTLGWLVSPGAPPVYDGLGNPDEPYRFVGAADAPAPVSVTVDAQDGGSQALQLRSPENGPQVLVDLAAGALRVPGRSVTMTATPLEPEGTPPRGEFDGNVYRISAAGSTGFDAEKAQGFLLLRAAVMTRPDPVIVRRAAPGEPWVEQKTYRQGRDVLSVPLRALGDYAVVRLPGATPLDEGGLTTTRLLLIGGGVLLLVGITVLVLRRQGSDS